jgi:hypothetical protein
MVEIYKVEDERFVTYTGFPVAPGIVLDVGVVVGAFKN